MMARLAAICAVAALLLAAPIASGAGNPLGDIGSHEIMESVQQRLRFRTRTAFDFQRHHRSRRLADCAALAGELHVLDRAVGAEFHREMNFIAARWIVAVNANDVAFQFAEVPRPTRVIENHLLVEFLQLGIHAAKKRTAPSRISIMRSISASVL